MSDPLRNLGTGRARALRRDQTDAERRALASISNRQLGGFKFRRHYPIDRYFVDFACREASLVVEVDGGQHAINVGYDAERTEPLERAGWKVIRFWNNLVLEGPIGVLDVIL